MNPLQQYCAGNKKLIVIYDIELLASYFSIMMMDVDNPSDVYKYECYYTKDGVEVNELANMIKFLKYKVGLMIGYNNFHYDYPVLSKIMSLEPLIPSTSTKTLLNLMYKISQDTISSQVKTKTKTSQCIIPQIDLMVMNNWNKDNRWVSLKQLEFVMNFENVQDMPYSHDHYIRNTREAGQILAYNYNDVKATHLLYETCVNENMFTLRIQLEKIYGGEFISSPEPEIGEAIFASMMAKEMNIPLAELWKMRTHRETLSIGTEVLLPYIKFRTPEFNNLLEVYKRQTVTTLKGFFEDITDSNPAYDIIKKISREDLVIEANNWGKGAKRGGDGSKEKVKFLNVYFKGHTYAYGNGGIHSDMQGKTYKSNKDYMILDLDVASYYPNLAIVNGFKPAHLGEAFNVVYKGIYTERGTHAKGTPENYILKIILNSVYGKSNSEYSFLYDRLMTSQICINGQLLITMLIESMILDIGATCIMANTDGATFYIKRKDYEKAKKIAKDWMDLTGLELEEAIYKEQYFRDVNSYVWIPEDPKKKPKLKGCFEYFKNKELKDFHKNFSQRIVAEACVKQIIDKIPFKETIDECTEIEKFFIGVKAKKGSTIYTKEWSKDKSNFKRINLSKFTRFYVTHPSYSEKTLWKELEAVEKIPAHRNKRMMEIGQTSIFDSLPATEDPNVFVERHQQVAKGWNVLVANNAKGHSLDKIDYLYYYAECEKILNLISEI